VAFGFHPYFQIPAVPRSRWEVSFPVRRQLVLDERQIPTGQTLSVEPIAGAIGDRTWDDGFDQIDTPARFLVRGGGRTLEVQFVSGNPVAQIYAPPAEEYICIEPMTARTNALAGPDAGLTWVQPGDRSSAAFRIVPGLE
jgi:galactose mutarotase-like enzyme